MPRPNRTHKLESEARALLIAHLIAGDSNQQVRQALQNAGFASDLSRQALHYYRHLPEVEEALQDMDTEYQQAGLALRARRIALLDQLASEVRLRSIELHSQLQPKCPANSSNSPTALLCDLPDSEEVNSICEETMGHGKASADKYDGRADLIYFKAIERVQALLADIGRLVDAPARTTSGKSSPIVNTVGVKVQEDSPVAARARFNDMLEMVLKEMAESD